MAIITVPFKIGFLFIILSAKTPLSVLQLSEHSEMHSTSIKSPLVELKRQNIINRSSRYNANNVGLKRALGEKKENIIIGGRGSESSSFKLKLSVATVARSRVGKIWIL